MILFCCACLVLGVVLAARHTVLILIPAALATMMSAGVLASALGASLAGTIALLSAAPVLLQVGYLAVMMGRTHFAPRRPLQARSSPL